MKDSVPADLDLTLLTRGAAELGVSLTPSQCEAFATFVRELVDWNTRINLTSITEPHDIQVRHLLDSLTVLATLPPPVRLGERDAKLLDVGAGAGLPGIPLAIVLPKVSTDLLEATQKKCRFLEHIVAIIGLADATVLCGRAEDLGHQAELRESYDVVVARAVAPLATLAELCLPFARIGGRMIAQKKLGIDAEISAAYRAVNVLGGRIGQPVVVRLPIADEERLLVVIEKVRPTPRQYPRRPGIPARSPL